MLLKMCHIFFFLSLSSRFYRTVALISYLDSVQNDFRGRLVTQIKGELCVG